MHYTLHQLRIFHCVSQTQSITKAAEILHLTQPAVSIQLKNFQDQFPIPLTEVVGRKLFITDFGKEIALAAEKILGEMEAISYKSRAFQGELSGKLTLSVVSTGQYVMPYFLADFMNAHPGVELVLDVTNKSQVLASLEANQVDFSLVSVLPEKLLIDSVSLLPNKLYLVSGAGMQFDKPEYDGSLLNELPLIFREAGSGTRLVIEHYLQQNGISVRKKMELTSNEAVKQAVLAGLGVSIMPLIGIRHELELKLLQIIPVKGFPIVSNWNLIWLKSKRFSPVANAFLDFIQAEKDRIVAERFDWFVE